MKIVHRSTGALRVTCVVVLLCCAGGFALLRGASASGNSIPAVRDSIENDPTFRDTSLVHPGEDLLYEVSYAGKKLGRIRIHTRASDLQNGEVRYHANAFVDSYDGIPFVDIHVIDSTSMTGDYYSDGFHAFEKKGDQWIEEVSTYDFSDHSIAIERTLHDELHSPVLGDPVRETVKNIQRQFLDGLSMFFFARAHVREQATMNIPSVIYGKKGTTEFHFATERKMEEIDALKDKKIRVVGLEGTAHFKGLYGMTGDFSGWFTDDAAAVPVKAELGVIIGNVDIELIWWRRHGWVPPTIPKE